tara:strand:+ start:68 stop:325 length:258 start_codon:yes stop_codon:yes gene_type:complete
MTTLTQDDITKLAREAGFEGMTDHPALMRFANLIEAHKTEVITAEAYRCGYTDGMKTAAVICENLAVQQEVDVRDQCAAAIRTRN